MVANPQLQDTDDLIYPDSDGKPMADNTQQFRWIVTIKENLEILFVDNPDVFVAGDLLWYPVQGRNTYCQAPDVMVVFGQPKGDRGSYKQWQENDLAPQVVFEILSPNNTAKELSRKMLFYQRHGVEEYYIYDPDDNDLIGSQRSDQALTEIPNMDGWISPRLGIRFEILEDRLNIYTPDGQRFLTPVELAQQRDQERQRADEAQQRADRLAAKLQELGIDPESI